MLICMYIVSVILLINSRYGGYTYLQLKNNNTSLSKVLLFIAIILCACCVTVNDNRRLNFKTKENNSSNKYSPVIAVNNKYGYFQTPTSQRSNSWIVFNYKSINSA